MIHNAATLTSSALVALVLVACQAESADAPPATTRAAPVVAPAEPSAGEREYAALVAGWTPEAVDGCGRVLHETLGTRDLVQGALDPVGEPDAQAPELQEARQWLDRGNARLAEIRPLLERGTCTPDVTLALDEAVQLYVRAGSAASRAEQTAGG